MIFGQLDGDTLHEECGVFGIRGPGLDVARLTFFALQSLQHRGQESAGIAVAGEDGIRLRKRLGLVAQVFEETDLRHLRGVMAVGHTRYSTTGSTSRTNAGPMAADSDIGTIVVAHNGNIVNTTSLRDELETQGVRLDSTTDSEVIAHVIARAAGDSLVGKLQNALGKLVGAYSLVVLSPDEIVAVRDPNGIRPLCLGYLDGFPVVASESCALETVGAEFEREIERGEIVRLNLDGVESHWLQEQRPAATCLFEFIYFARPDSQMLGERLYVARQRMGEELAREAPVEADVVIPLPDSANPAAIGFSRESGIPFSEGLIKNRYVGRTFIQPDQRLREIGVSLKYNALPEVVEGKRVVIVDDSIVRGTTSRPIIDLLRRAGAREVHMRVHSPPIKHPCHLGVDMATREELIAANKTVEEITEIIGADSLAYLSLDGLLRATGRQGAGFCHACLSGQYPVSVDESTGKFALELKKTDSVERPKPIQLTQGSENGLESPQAEDELATAVAGRRSGGGMS